MKSFKVILMLFNCIFILTGCSFSTESNSSPEKLLENNPKADFFVIDDVAYVNASEVAWVNETILTKDNILGKIENTGVRNYFTNWSATELEVNTEIYKIKQRNDILLAKIGDKLIPYLAYMEG